jgi:hypothetical protein
VPHMHMGNYKARHARTQHDLLYSPPQKGAHTRVKPTDMCSTHLGALEYVALRLVHVSMSTAHHLSAREPAFCLARPICGNVIRRSFS